MFYENLLASPQFESWTRQDLMAMSCLPLPFMEENKAKRFHETCIIFVRTVPPDLTEKSRAVAIDLAQCFK